MPACLVGLGSNLGDRPFLLSQGVAQLAQTQDIRLVACSSWHETAPAGGPAGQGPFLNGAVLLETTLTPQALLARLHAVETGLGRRREERWGSRTLDLDLLLYGEQVLDSAELTLPHPRMSFRRFVLEPAAEVAPELVHPRIGWSLLRLLEHLNTSTNYVAIAGPIAAGKRKLAADVLARVPGRLIADPPNASLLAAFYADPTGLGWTTEIEFLRRRQTLLAGESWLPPHAATTGDVAISDFWFGQSLAYADVWLRARERAAFQVIWQAAAGSIIRPKLIVALDVPSAEVRRRVDSRGDIDARALDEKNLDDDALVRIATAVLRQATMPGEGPVLHLPVPSHGGSARLADEVTAAIRAML